jgi:hypothetical protein
MCEVDWSALAAMIAGGATLWMAFAAWLALGAWRDQLQGETDHQLARDLATATVALKNRLVDFRQAFFMDWELPEADAWSDDLEKDALAIRMKRWQPVLQARARLTQLLDEAEAIWGPEVATSHGPLLQLALEVELHLHATARGLRKSPPVPASQMSRHILGALDDKSGLHQKLVQACAAALESFRDKLAAGSASRGGSRN